MTVIHRETIIPFTHGELRLWVRLTGDLNHLSQPGFTADSTFRYAISSALVPGVLMLNSLLDESYVRTGGSTQASESITATVFGITVKVGFEVLLNAEIDEVVLASKMTAALGFDCIEDALRSIISAVGHPRMLEIDPDYAKRIEMFENGDILGALRHRPTSHDDERPGQYL